MERVGKRERGREGEREVNEVLRIGNNLVLQTLRCHMALNTLFNSSVCNFRNENTLIVPGRMLYRLSKGIANFLRLCGCWFTYLTLPYIFSIQQQLLTSQVASMYKIFTLSIFFTDPSQRNTSQICHMTFWRTWTIFNSLKHNSNSFSQDLTFCLGQKWLPHSFLDSFPGGITKTHVALP